MRERGWIQCECLFGIIGALADFAPSLHSALFSLVYRNEFFQGMLNKIVVFVVSGMTSSLQGAQLVHSCAAILGMDLLKPLPATTLVITGMRKTNNIAQGQKFILKAFKAFGKMDEAAIAPNNRGFGKTRSLTSCDSCVRHR